MDLLPDEQVTGSIAHQTLTLVCASCKRLDRVEETLKNNTIVVVCVLALKTRKRSIINILSTRCVVGLVSKNFRTSPAGAKRQPTGGRGGRFSS
jgi:hypothetical protein